MKNQKDNSTFDQKVLLRRRIITALSSISAVCETHGGWGKLYGACYASIETGVVFETNEEKATALAVQRPTWRVYESDCEAGLAAGIGADLPIDLLDCGPYGQPWPILEAFFASERERPRRIGVVVNDVLRSKLVTRTAHEVASIKEYYERFGEGWVYENYLDLCKDKLSKIAATRDYKLKLWAAYYRGPMKRNSHYAAVFERTGKRRG